MPWVTLAESEHPWVTLAESDFEFKLIPKLQLGNARSRSSASRTQGLLALNAARCQGVEAELRGRRSQAGAWERE